MITNNKYSLTKIITEITEYPEKHLGKKCLIRLSLFIQGWLVEKTNVFDIMILSDINLYVSKIYDVNSDHSWAEILNFYSKNTDEAFEKFIDIFNELKTKYL